MKKFVLLSTQRSGSTFLRIWLNSHSKIDSHGEVFLGRYESQDGLKIFCERSFLADRLRFALHHNFISNRLNIDLISRDMVDRYLHSLFFDPGHPAPWTNIHRRDELIRKKSPEVTGFKLMYNTLARYPALQDWMDEEKDLRVIHLIRYNLLKSFISGERMRQSKVAHTKDRDFKFPPVYIDLKKLQTYFEVTHEKQAYYRKYFSVSHPYLELSYEEIFADKESSILKILNFFSLQKEEMLLPGMKKISSKKLADEVVNPEQLVESLSGTGYESYLKDYEW